MPLDLKAIKERLAKATPGPWRAGRGALDDPCSIDAPDPDYPGDDDYGIGVMGGDGNKQIEDGDREFIEHAHADLAALVSEVESLRALLSQAEWNGDDFRCPICGRAEPRAHPTFQHVGHSRDCALASALREEP